MFLFAACKKELKSTRSVLSRQGYRRKTEKGFNLFCARLLSVCADSRFTKPRNFSKGFNFVSRNLLFLCADSRFGKPRCSLNKVLIVAVRRCHCGGLNRGLQNLGASCKGDVFRAFRLYEKNQKYTIGLRTSGLRGRFKALPEVTLQKFPAASAETGFPCKTPAKRL